MRGSPLLQTLFIVVVFALAGLPVWRLTRPAKAEAGAVFPMPESGVPKATPLEVEADFAPAPADFHLKSLDQPVLDGHGPQARFTSRWSANVPPEGVDLVMQAQWPAPSASSEVTPLAARVIVRFPDGHSVEKSFWAGANGSLTEVFTVPGATP